MTSTLSQLYDYTRTSVDSDSTELPDSLMLFWANAAEQRIFECFQTTDKFYASTAEISSSGTSPILSGATPNPEIRDPLSVSGPNWQLQPIDHDEALARFPLNADSTTPETFGNALFWSYDYALGTGTLNIWLWPCPSSVQVFRVTGYRMWALMTLASSIPDFPSDVAPLIGEYMVSRALEMQSNVTVAAMKMNRFEAELDIMRRRFNRPAKAATTVVGGRDHANRVAPVRLRFPFE